MHRLEYLNHSFGLAAVEIVYVEDDAFDRHQLGVVLLRFGIGQFAQALEIASHQADNAEPRTIVGRAAAFLDEAHDQPSGLQLVDFCCRSCMRFSASSRLCRAASSRATKVCSVWS